MMAGMLAIIVLPAFASGGGGDPNAEPDGWCDDTPTQTTSAPQFYCMQGPGGSCNGGPVQKVPPDEVAGDGPIPFVEDTLDTVGTVGDYTNYGLNGLTDATRQ